VSTLAGAPPLFTARILKAGASLGDVRRLLEVWDDEASPQANLRAIVQGNLLGKATRTRAADVSAALRARYVDPGPQVIPALRLLTAEPPAFVDACWYETTRSDPLLAAFAEEAVDAWSHSGQTAVTVDGVEGWVRAQAAGGRAPAWSDQVTRRVAHGLVATSRDLGALIGAVRKEVAPPRLSTTGLVYVAFRLHEQGASSRVQVEGPIWRRWRLRSEHVEALFVEAARSGVLRFSRVGSSVRLDWQARSLSEAVEVANAAG